MRHLLPILLFCFLTNTLFSQQLDHVLGELLVKLKEDQSVDHFQQELTQFRGQQTALKAIERVERNLDIWRLEFDNNTVNENDFLDYIRQRPEVELAQFNHLVSLRSTVPNDPQFGQQWQYINNGSSGGLIGADIDADLAWDISTGGVTATGDTIVVCVLDEGFDQNHEDLIPNLWVNHAEIPDNGMDDDGNGYIDDYSGWNTDANSDNINVGGWHGTAVAGIVGAKGNNNLGVTGVNWDVKLMLVVHNSLRESDVLASYSFPLTHRKRYNETDGAEGAYVVATNASWGANRRWASDAPLWCAMYDSLGVHGILNCGATTNLNDNVDEVGDMPTSCASEYLISVTNLTNNDVKNQPAGYGAIHVDLGAYGAGTYAPDNNNTYSPFGGTSGATPHVCGAIGLLYSTPSAGFMGFAKADPAAAALSIKQYIFDGVVHNESLEGITVTEGRLNLYNSLNNLTLDFGPCPEPYALKAIELQDTSLVLQWSNSDSVLHAGLRYRMLGDTNWIELDSINKGHKVEGLQGCTSYEFQIKSVCSDTTSKFSSIKIFETEGCCTAPEKVLFSGFDSGVVQAEWPSVYAGMTYNFQYRLQDSMEWTTLNVVDTSFLLMDLENCAHYEYRVESVCDIDSISGYSDIRILNTFCPCSQPANVDTTLVGFNSFTLVWDSVSVAVEYDIRYKVLGVVNWTFIQSTSPRVTIDELNDCTSYIYQVRADCNTQNSGYSGSKIVTTQCIVGLEELSPSVRSLQLYPSPFQSQFFLQLDLDEALEFTVELRNLSGQQIYQQHYDLSAGSHQLPMSVEENLASGLYLVGIHSESGSIVKKVVKQ